MAITAEVGSGLDDLVLTSAEDALHKVAVAVRSLRCEGELGQAAPVGPGFEDRPLHSGRDGPTVEDAVSKLTWRDGDLIMVGSSRLSAPKRLFLGSTAAKMLRVLDVPMMVVPRDQLGEHDLP